MIFRGYKKAYHMFDEMPQRGCLAEVSVTPFWFILSDKHNYSAAALDLPKERGGYTAAMSSYLEARRQETFAPIQNFLHVRYSPLLQCTVGFFLRCSRARPPPPSATSDCAPVNAHFFLSSVWIQKRPTDCLLIVTPKGGNLWTDPMDDGHGFPPTS
ncbi:hypothetical protein LXL04_004602 [Taraxacum kok-saghyz]